MEETGGRRMGSKNTSMTSLLDLEWTCAWTSCEYLQDVAGRVAQTPLKTPGQYLHYTCQSMALNSWGMNGRMVWLLKYSVCICHDAPIRSVFSKPTQHLTHCVYLSHGLVNRRPTRIPIVPRLLACQATKWLESKCKVCCMLTLKVAEGNGDCSQPCYRQLAQGSTFKRCRGHFFLTIKKNFLYDGYILKKKKKKTLQDYRLVVAWCTFQNVAPTAFGESLLKPLRHIGAGNGGSDTQLRRPRPPKGSLELMLASGTTGH